MTTRASLLAVITAALLHNTAWAQEIDNAPPDDTSEPIICVVPLTRWVPTGEQTAKILTEPVPEAFAAMFEGGPCNTLDKAGLIDWHINFGNEQSAKAALSYYAHRWVPESIDPEEYTAALERAWELSRSQFKLASRLQLEGRHHDASELRQRNGRILQMFRVFRIADAHLALFEYTLQAAEFYNSPELLADAEALLPVIEARNVFYERHRETLEALGGVTFEDPRRVDHLGSARLLPYRLASLRLRMGEATVDPESARAMVVGPYAEAIEEAGDLAWQNEGIHEIDETRLEALRAADDAEDNFMLFAIQILFEDVRVAMAKATGEQRSKCDPGRYYETMILLEELEKDGHDEGIPLGYSGHSFPHAHRDMRLELILSRADCEHRLAAQFADADDFDQADDRFYQTFEALEQARQLVQPDESPTRFRHVAERYLEASERCRIMNSEASRMDLEPSCPFSINSRLETYFRANLSALDSIATGNGSQP